MRSGVRAVLRILFCALGFGVGIVFGISVGDLVGCFVSWCSERVEFFFSLDSCLRIPLRNSPQTSKPGVLKVGNIPDFDSDPYVV